MPKIQVKLRRNVVTQLIFVHLKLRKTQVESNLRCKLDNAFRQRTLKIGYYFHLFVSSYMLNYIFVVEIVSDLRKRLLITTVSGHVFKSH